MKLYRAAENAQARAGAHFTPDPAVARTYLSSSKLLYEVELSNWRELDARGGLKGVATALEALTGRAAWQIEEDWWSLKLKSVFDLLEQRPEVREQLSSQFDWIRFDEDFPPGAEGWQYLGATPLALTPSA